MAEFTSGLEEKKKFFSSKITEWYENAVQNYPWRTTSDPYEVLIAEILLKKTTREQVLKVFSRFTKRYRSVSDLCTASPAKLEEDLKPLGMQRVRAKTLIQVAESILKEHGGKVPLSIHELKSIPGIGPYTAAAVVCLTRNLPYPMVDTNAARVICRFFGFKPKNKRPYLDRELFKLAESLIPPGKARNFNFGLIDFGNTICRSRNPRCCDCILGSHCEFKAKNHQRSLHSRTRKSK